MLKSIVARSWQTSRPTVAASVRCCCYLACLDGWLLGWGVFATKYPAESSFHQTYPKSRANTHIYRPGVINILCTYGSRNIEISM